MLHPLWGTGRASIGPWNNLLVVCAQITQKGVSLPNRFGVKSPSSHREFAWYYLLSSDHESKCPQSGMLYRHHQDMGHIARQIKLAAVRCGFAKRVTSHCLRHSFATHSLENGVPIHIVQKLLGHTDIKTTERYLHMSKDGVTAAKSPLESLERKIEPSPMEEMLRNPVVQFRPRIYREA